MKSVTKVSVLTILVLCATLFGIRPAAAQVQGTWTTAASALDLRFFEAEVSLTGGGAMLAGGTVDGFNILTSAELYSFATGKWTFTGSMATGREFFPLVTLKTGKVLAPGGGGTSSAILSSAELYDPTSATWSSAGNLALARYAHTATLLSNGEVLVAGGCTAIACAPYAGPSELYNPTTNAWTTVGSLNTPREGHTATLLKTGKVLVVGGTGGATTELYDPNTATWSYGPNTIVARSSHTATLLPDGDVLVTGGFLNRAVLASAEIYDPIANTWTLTGNMTSPRELHTATLLKNGTVLIAAGATVHSCGRNGICSTPLNSAEIYNPSTGVFTATGSLNSARDSQVASALKGGQVLAEGGFNAFGATLNSAEYYVPLTLSMTASSLNLGFEQLGVTSPSQTVTLTDVSPNPVTFNSVIGSGGDFLTTTTCSGTLSPGQTCTITVTFTPSTAGTRTGSVTISDNSPGSPKQTITLTGVGEVNAASFSPSSYTFPGQLINTSSAPVSVTLVNDGTVAVTLSSVAITPPNTFFTQTNNCPTTLAVNQTCTIQVVFTPNDAVTFNATLEATDTAPGSPQTMALTGTGLDN